jgi:hypothetical protein
MRVRNKTKGYLGHSTDFNIHAMSEIIIYFDEGDCSSEFIKDYYVYIESIGEWMDMHEAFDKKYIITDNYNTCFAEPSNETEKERGYF